LPNKNTGNTGKEVKQSEFKVIKAVEKYARNNLKVNLYTIKITTIMATILKQEQREFKEDPNKIDNFRIFTDISRVKKGLNPQNLNFDLRQLNPGQYCAAYHFHRHAEELFMIISGSATLRTPDGLEIVNSGDLIFFEAGEKGAHQLYNHTEEACIYLDIRTFMGYDVCEYPDSNKIFLVPSYEIFGKNTQLNYFDGEENIRDKWEQIEHKKA
jgi:uncharacterized cupin superfamily protein